MASIPRKTAQWQPPPARLEGDRLLKEAAEAAASNRFKTAGEMIEEQRANAPRAYVSPIPGISPEPPDYVPSDLGALREKLVEVAKDVEEIKHRPAIGGTVYHRARVSEGAVQNVVNDFIGVTIQAYSANLDEYAAVNPTAAGLALLDDADAAAQRATLGLGTAAIANVGTSGDTVPKNNTANTFSNTQTVESAAGSAAFVLKKNVATQGNFLRGYTGSTIRWDLALGGGGAESGANAGAPFQVISYDDAGSLLGVPLSIVRATGVVTMPFGATVGDASGDPVILKGTTVNSYSSGLLDNADAAAWRTDLGLGSAAVLTAGDASGNLKALNADGALTFNLTTQPSIQIGSVFGTDRLTNHLFTTSTSATTDGTKSYATAAFVRESAGYDVFSAGDIDTALHVEAKRKDYLTSEGYGQTAAAYFVAYGNRRDNHGAIYIDVNKVFDGTYDGSIQGIEASVKRRDATGANIGATQAYMLWSMSNTGTNFAPDGTVGFGVEPRTGETYAAFAAVERSDLSAAFEYVLAASTSRDNANTFFRITGTGNASGAGRVHAQGSGAFPAFSFIGDENTGVVSPAADQVGFSTGGTTRFWVTTAAVNSALPVTFLNGLAIPANGSTGNGIKFSSTANFGVFFGSGAPTLSAAKGSLYLRSDGSGTTNRAYINTDGSTGWTALTTAA